MPRLLTTRERLADHLYFYLQIVSRFVFVLGAIVGYAFNGFIGCCLLGVGGVLCGIWLRRSMGMRGIDPFHGYFQRIKERANGSRRGLLEWGIETMRGGGPTVCKCQAITKSYERAMDECRLTSSPAQQKAILQRLDAEVKLISYSG